MSLINQPLNGHTLIDAMKSNGLPSALFGDDVAATEVIPRLGLANQLSPDNRELWAQAIRPLPGEVVVVNMEITPSIASQMLQFNTNNRNLSKANREKLRHILRTGQWKFNGETICFSDKALLNGQHRLTEIAVMSLVVFNVPEDVFDTIDTQKPRSHADVLSVNGEANAHALAAALKLVDRYFTGRLKGYTPIYTNQDIERLLETYPDCRKSVRFLSSGGRGLMYGSSLAALHYLFSQKDEELADFFIQRLLSGENLEIGDPIYVLRERLVRNSMSKAKLRELDLLAMCVKAWNLKRQGKSCDLLKWANSEPFPLVQ